jgi:hypothetical protein
MTNRVHQTILGFKYLKPFITVTTMQMKSVILGLLLVLICLPPLHAQTATNAPANNAAGRKDNTVISSAGGQAPEEATNKITELVHAGKYAEAQQLTTGLLVAYPNDQRLIKAKALMEKLLAPAGSANASSSNQPANTMAPAQAAPTTKAESLVGMEKVDYSALIVLARQAQQTTDLSEQKKLLKQFMDQSSLFLQKHPDQTLLWQLRAASAISLNQPMEGYEAGQKLLGMGAADSDDPALQQLLGQLKNKSWLDKLAAEQAEEAAKLWIDPATGLIWATEDNGSDVAWEQAMDYCGNLQLSGHSDWRLPAIDELRGIYDPSISTPSQCCDGTQLPWQVKGNMQLSGWHWSSSQGNGSGEAWTFYFHDGGLDSAPRGFSRHVRALCVRSSPQQPASQRTVMTRAPGPLTPAPVAQADSSTIVPSSSQPASSSGPATAILHLYRLSHMGGKFSQYDIEIDGRRVAKIANAQSVGEYLSPGKHNINVFYRAVKSDRPLYNLEMESGKEYWIRIDLADGFIEHMRLALVPEAEAREESGKLKEAANGDLPAK